MEKIAGQPAAAWMGNWFPQIEMAVKTYVWSRTRGGGLPVMILYNLPFRDCGGYSAGGAGSAAGYRKWIDNVAAGVGSRRAVFVLEPDGLPLMTKCLKPDKQEERVAMIRYAVEKLMSLPGAAVYIDAGHSAWVPAAEMAPRLKAAGIDLADGFSLNVSNYQATPDLMNVRPHALGAARRQALHHRHQPQRQRRARRGLGRRRARLVQPRRPRARHAADDQHRRSAVRRLLLAQAARRIRRPLQPRPGRRQLVAGQGAGDGPQRQVVARSTVGPNGGGSPKTRRG